MAERARLCNLECKRSTGGSRAAYLAAIDTPLSLQPHASLAAWARVWAALKRQGANMQIAALARALHISTHGRSTFPSFLTIHTHTEHRWTFPVLAFDNARTKFS